MSKTEQWPVGRYRLEQRSYIPSAPGMVHELLEAGTEITFDGKPGPHMTPLDEGAALAYELSGAKDVVLDPFSRIPLNAPTENDAQAERIAEAVAKATSEVTASAMAAAMAQIATAALTPTAPAASPPASPPPPPPPPPAASGGKK